MDDKLIAATIEPLDTAKQTAVKKAFGVMEKALDAMTGEYNEILEKDITKELCGDARSLRLRISKVRNDGEKWKTKEKKQYLEAGNAIQGLYNYLFKDTSKKEGKLKEVEEHFKREAEAKIEKIKTDRLAQLEPYDVDSSFVDLGNMPDEAWKAHLAGIVLAHEKAIEDEQKQSETQKARDLQMDVFAERKEALMPYAQFSPFIDLYPETPEEEYQGILASMQKMKQEFDDKQADMFQENEKLKNENQALTEVVEKVAEPEVVDKFKKDIFAGFSFGGTDVKPTAKDTSLGEMLGFDEPEEKKEDQSLFVPIEKDFTELERINKCIDLLVETIPFIHTQLAKHTLKTCVNNLQGVAILL